jgi:hypothetical protein
MYFTAHELETATIVRLGPDVPAGGGLGTGPQAATSCDPPEGAAGELQQPGTIRDLGETPFEDTAAPAGPPPATADRSQPQAIADLDEEPGEEQGDGSPMLGTGRDEEPD